MVPNRVLRPDPVALLLSREHALIIGTRRESTAEDFDFQGSGIMKRACNNGLAYCITYQTKNMET